MTSLLGGLTEKIFSDPFRDTCSFQAPSLLSDSPSLVLLAPLPEIGFSMETATASPLLEPLPLTGRETD